MSQITVQCQLVADGETRQYLWRLMADIYTPFINEMLARIAQHQCFEEWSKAGRIPADIFKDLRRSLKDEPAFQGMPGRWYNAGRDLVKRIYKSWLARRRRMLSQLTGQTHWLDILQSYDDLVAACEQDLSAIRTEATAILARLQAETSGNSG